MYCLKIITNDCKVCFFNKFLYLPNLQTKLLNSKKHRNLLQEKKQKIKQTKKS